MKISIAVLLGTTYYIIYAYSMTTYGMIKPNAGQEYRMGASRLGTLNVYPCNSCVLNVV